MYRSPPHEGIVHRHKESCSNHYNLTREFIVKGENIFSLFGENPRVIKSRKRLVGCRVVIA